MLSADFTIVKWSEEIPSRKLLLLLSCFLEILLPSVTVSDHQVAEEGKIGREGRA
jgi:hypothetical protein